jgi:hypothetical protein
MEKVYKIPNLFSEEQIAVIDEIVGAAEPEKEDSVLGRALYAVAFPPMVTTTLIERVSELLGKTIDKEVSSSYVEYRKEYGQPNLPPHFDGDSNDLIVDYQLRSNTDWGIGLDCEFFSMKDNDALVFNPNENAHWRPHKTFEDGQYVGMLFFRFPDYTGKINYANKRYPQNHPIFDEAIAFRNSLGPREI